MVLLKHGRNTDNDKTTIKHGSRHKRCRDSSGGNGDTNMNQPWKVGDRVILPACDNAAGTVTFVNRVTGYTDVKYDDGEQAACDAASLQAEPSREGPIH